MPLLKKGEIDIGFVLGEVAHELFAGIGRPPTRLEVILVMYPTPGMFAVHADSRFRSIVDLRDRPVAWNSCGSGLAVQGRYVMDGLGLDAEKDFEPVLTERLAEGPQMVLDGRAAALWGGGLRWPGFVTIASNARGARFVVPDAEESSRIMAKHRFLRRFTAPAGTYPGQSDPIESVGSWSFIMARADLDDAVGYRLAALLLRIERANISLRQLGGEEHAGRGARSRSNPSRHAALLARARAGALTIHSPADQSLALSRALAAVPCRLAPSAAALESRCLSASASARSSARRASMRRLVGAIRTASGSWGRPGA